MEKCEFSLRNRFLRGLCRAWPITRGKWRLMTEAEKLLKPETGTIELFGHSRFYLDLNRKGLESSFYFFYPERYEYETQTYLSTHVRKGMTVFDIGAHIGFFTLLLAQLVAEEGRVFSFEPESVNFSLLMKNIETNGLRQVTAFPHAVSNRRGTATLTLDSTSSGHSLTRSGGDRLKTQNIETVCLDDFCSDHGIETVDLIKIDAEEHEDKVLEGAKVLLSKHRIKEIICEIHSTDGDSAETSAKARNILYDHGYKSYVLNSVLSKKEFLSELTPSEKVSGLQNILFRHCFPMAERKQ
ncbi:MAG: 31-O-demethyl-FK506 methyltransferase FkbM [Chloroflexi bacterium ADurb.Bin344]|nr:MAG: 31-O-demethyl-FK506 methyltransferase FkbM [Chloroflexi bacterium ADurb.Bin344]